MINVGFDLGSSKCVACISEVDKVQVLTDEDHERLIRTCICFDKSSQFFGSKAVNNMRRCFKSVFMNSIYDRFLPIDNPTSICLTFGGVEEIIMDGQKFMFNSLQLTAMCISHLESILNIYLGETKKQVRSLTVNVPAFYNIYQREYMKKACRIAISRNIEIVDDLTAVGVHYAECNVGIKNGMEMKVAVIIMGHSSTQIGVFKYRYNKMEHCGTIFDKSLGGRNFDRKLYNELKRQFQEKTKITIEDRSRESLKLLEECVKVKHLLSMTGSDLPIHIDSLAKDYDLQTTIRRSKFEELCQDEFDRFENLLNKCSHLMQSEEQKDVVFLGGSSMITKLREMVNHILRTPLNNSLNEVEAVVRGCSQYVHSYLGLSGSAIRFSIVSDYGIEYANTIDLAANNKAFFDICWTLPFWITFHCAGREKVYRVSSIDNAEVIVLKNMKLAISKCNGGSISVRIVNDNDVKEAEWITLPTYLCRSSLLTLNLKHTILESQPLYFCLIGDNCAKIIMKEAGKLRVNGHMTVRHTGTVSFELRTASNNESSSIYEGKLCIPFESLTDEPSLMLETQIHFYIDGSRVMCNVERSYPVHKVVLYTSDNPADCKVTTKIIPYETNYEGLEPYQETEKKIRDISKKQRWKDAQKNEYMSKLYQIQNNYEKCMKRFVVAEDQKALEDELSTRVRSKGDVEERDLLRVDELAGMNKLCSIYSELQHMTEDARNTLLKLIKLKSEMLPLTHLSDGATPVNIAPAGFQTMVGQFCQLIMELQEYGYKAYHDWTAIYQASNTTSPYKLLISPGEICEVLRTVYCLFQTDLWKIRFALIDYINGLLSNSSKDNNAHIYNAYKNQSFKWITFQSFTGKIKVNTDTLRQEYLSEQNMKTLARNVDNFIHFVTKLPFKAGKMKDTLHLGNDNTDKLLLLFDRIIYWNLPNEQQLFNASIRAS